MNKSRVTHFDGAFILPVWLVNVYVFLGTCGYLASILVERDSFEVRLLFDVGSLEDMIRSVEYYKSVAGDISLHKIPRVSIVEEVRSGGTESYNDLVALPQPMGDGLQLRLRATWKNAAHGNCR